MTQLSTKRTQSAENDALCSVCPKSGGLPYRLKVLGDKSSQIVFLVPPADTDERYDRFISKIAINTEFIVERDACVVPLILCPMKPCVSKHRNCMREHLSRYLDRAKVVVLVGKEAYAVHLDSGSISEMLYGTDFKENGKTYFCFSDYRNLCETNPRMMDYAPANVWYWEDRINKEITLFRKFVRKLKKKRS